MHFPWLKHAPLHVQRVANSLPQKHVGIRMAGDEAVLDLFGGVGDEVNGILATDVSTALKKAKGAKSLTVRINSPGGFAYEGLAIHNMIREFDGEVTTINLALAASAASVILVAGHKVLAAESSSTMIHEATLLTWGDIAEHELSIKSLKHVNSVVIGVYARKTSLSRDKLAALLKATTWMDATEAKKHGFVDSVVEDKVNKSSSENRIAAQYPRLAEARAIQEKADADTARNRELITLLGLREQNAELDRRAAADIARFERNRKRFAARAH